MLRPEEMAFLTEQMRHEIKKQQLAGKKTMILTFDGNIEGKEAFEAENNSYMVRISDTPIDLTEDNFVGFEMRFGGISFTDPAMISFADQDEPKARYIFFTAEGDAMPIGAILYEEIATDEITIKKGVYFIWAGDAGYLARLSYSEIHPIPAEYIPPLDALYLNGTDGVRYKLYVDAAGQLQVEVV